ncbi:MAG: hypothetical protein G8237_01085 [Magnetococcales bacterium]|nr:hypothetical protein [Magnetococcales bacterium]NGZ04931.1 hypothetical protein [Magnetococcales bacterium]
MPALSHKNPVPRHPTRPLRPYAGDPEIRTLDNENARRLWAAVLERAILDLQERTTRAEAVAWISSNRRSVGSFQWICQQLDMDPASVKHALLGQHVMTPMMTQTATVGKKSQPVLGTAHL